jgi:hypothetical protein
MNIYPAGAAYTEGEYFAWLSAAGCDEEQRFTLPDGRDAIRATKRQ